MTIEEETGTVIETGIETETVETETERNETETVVEIEDEKMKKSMIFTSKV